MSNPHQITRDFEAALCAYTGAKYAVAVTSCTMAILLAVKWCIHQHKKTELGKKTDILCHLNGGVYRPIVSIPKRTYVSVPQSIIHAGGRPAFTDEKWSGEYRLSPLPVWDCARRFTSGMHRSGQFETVSFHTSKILNDSQGGAILHDDDEADGWFRRMRFDGRTENVPANEDDITEIGYHCYMSPDVAARLLWKLSVLPENNPDLPNDAYPDCSKLRAFR